MDITPLHTEQDEKRSHLERPGTKDKQCHYPSDPFKKPKLPAGMGRPLNNNMADSTRSDNSRPLLTKQDLLDCFATKVFAQHVTAAMSHDIGKLISSVNANKQAVQEQQQHLAELRGVVSLQQKHLETQAQQIKELSTMKTKIENNERREQQKNLIITGLSETDPKNHLLRLIRENLNIQIHENDFSLTTKEARKRPNNAEESRAQSTSGSHVNTTNDNDGASKRLSTAIFTSVWKKKAVYRARGGLRGTEVFLSEDLSVSQRALFFKCREMRRAGKVKQTWTRDLSIYVKTNTDETIKIETEADLSTLENTTHRTIAPNPAPVTNPIMSTPFTTPRTSPAQSQTWSEDSSHSSFHGFDPMEYTPQPTTSAFSTSLWITLTSPPNTVMFVDMLKGWFPDVFAQTSLAILLYKMQCSECMNGRYPLRNVTPHYCMYVKIRIDGQNCMNVSYSKQSVKCLNERCALLNVNLRWKRSVTPECKNCVTAPHSCMHQCVCMMMYDRVNCMIVLQLWLHICMPCERDDWNPPWRKFVTPDCENWCDCSAFQYVSVCLYDDVWPGKLYDCPATMDIYMHARWKGWLEKFICSQIWQVIKLYLQM